MVVLPSVLNSDGFFHELMPMIHHGFPASPRREDNFIAGMSMGGNGTLSFGLSHPERFGGMAVLSSTAREVECLRPLAPMTAGHKVSPSINAPVEVLMTGGADWSAGVPIHPGAVKKFFRRRGLHFCRMCAIIISVPCGNGGIGRRA